MEIKDIRTRDDFIAFLKSQDATEIEDADLEEVADWFLAIQEARLILNACTTKDLARILLDGYESIEKNPVKAHERFWKILFEDVDHAREKGNMMEAIEFEQWAVEQVVDMLTEHFGVDF